MSQLKKIHLLHNIMLCVGTSEETVGLSVFDRLCGKPMNQEKQCKGKVKNKTKSREATETTGCIIYICIISTQRASKSYVSLLCKYVALVRSCKLGSFEGLKWP